MRCEWISTFNKQITFRICGVLLACLSSSSDISMTRWVSMQGLPSVFTVVYVLQ